jgi:hypothetical protein
LRWRGGSVDIKLQVFPSGSGIKILHIERGPPCW